GDSPGRPCVAGARCLPCRHPHRRRLPLTPTPGPPLPNSVALTLPNSTTGLSMSSRETLLLSSGDVGQSILEWHGLWIGWMVWMRWGCVEGVGGREPDHGAGCVAWGTSTNRFGDRVRWPTGL